MVRLDERLDGMIERTIGEEAYERSILLTRRGFLKMLIVTGLSIGTGIGFAGCSSKGPGGNIEFKPPLQSGYKLIYPKNSKPVPDDVISSLIEIGKKYFVVWAPGDIDVDIEDKSIKEGYREIPVTAVTPDMRILGFTSYSNYIWLIGDDEAYDDRMTGSCPVELAYPHIKELSSDINFVNNNMGIYGALFIEGVSGDKAYASHTFIEQGGGKVASFVYVIPFNPEKYKRYFENVGNPLEDPEPYRRLKDPKYFYKIYKRSYERYAFHSKEKLNKMWIEITSAHKISEIQIFGHKLGVKPEEWYKIPDEALKKWPPVG